MVQTNCQLNQEDKQEGEENKEIRGLQEEWISKGFSFGGFYKLIWSLWSNLTPLDHLGKNLILIGNGQF